MRIPLSTVVASTVAALLPSVVAVPTSLPVTAANNPANTVPGVGSTPGWHLGAQGINARAAWKQSRGKGITIAVIDTGVASSPTELRGKFLPGYDFVSSPVSAADGMGRSRHDSRDSNPADVGDWFPAAGLCDLAGEGYEIKSSWHGTSVASVVNQVAPEARIVPIRALGRCGGEESDIADAILWAAGLPTEDVLVPRNRNPARIINLSFGTTEKCSPSAQSAINRAVRSGAIVVAAAGNEGAQASTFTPGNCRNVLTVAATGPNGAAADWSNRGTRVDLAAPGERIRALSNTGTRNQGKQLWTVVDGTSFAAPQVSGTLALMLSKNPATTNTQAVNIIRRTATPVRGRIKLGSGVVNTARAVALVPARSAKVAR